jgi:hypothetical protein
MNTSTEVDTFIRSAKDQGVDDSAIVALLKHTGWSERRIYRSLSRYYSETIGVVPPGRSQNGDNARDAFMYAINFITLGFWTTALGNLCYIVIARAFPDAAARSSGAGFIGGRFIDEISWQLAATLIALPAFLWMNRTIENEMRRRADLADSPIRSWLTYAALVLGALVVLCDGIWFLETLLRGELSIRFLLDSLVLLVLGGGVIVYYLSGLKPVPNAE